MVPDEKDDPEQIDPELRRIMQIPDDQELPPDILCDVMIRALESHQLLIRTSAVNQLVDLGLNHSQMAIPKILAALDPAIDYWTVRFGAVEALGEIADKSTIKPLIEYLQKDDDPDFRAMIAKQFGEMGSVALEAGPALVEALSTRDHSEIRENAAYALGKIRYKASINSLKETLAKEKDNYAKRKITWSLGEFGDQQAVDILIQTLKDFDKETRANAAEALGKIKEKVSIIPLLKSTQDTDVEVQTKAIEALKKFSEGDVISEVEKMSGGDRLVAIQLFDEYLFNIENELIVQKVKAVREPIIAEYRGELAKIKTELETCKVFVEEVFGKLLKISKDEINQLLVKDIPQIESRVASIQLYKFRKHKWLRNDLFFDLDQVTSLYREAGIMVSELRDNASNLLKRKVDEVKPSEKLSNDQS
ncbi:HEAT repeat domain-containing protein [Candidatus Hodarchaeum mangrovi]